MKDTQTHNADLISRSALLDYCDAKAFDALDLWDGGRTREAWLKAFEAVRTAPTIDAVEVVRCKDCKHRGFAGECPMCYTEAFYDGDLVCDGGYVDGTVDEGFCHCGEKRDTEVEG